MAEPSVYAVGEASLQKREHDEDLRRNHSNDERRQSPSASTITPQDEDDFVPGGAPYISMEQEPHLTGIQFQTSESLSVKDTSGQPKAHVRQVTATPPSVSDHHHQGISQPQGHQPQHQKQYDSVPLPGDLSTPYLSTYPTAAFDSDGNQQRRYLAPHFPGAAPFASFNEGAVPVTGQSVEEGEGIVKPSTDTPPVTTGQHSAPQPLSKPEEGYNNNLQDIYPSKSSKNGIPPTKDQAFGGGRAGGSNLSSSSQARSLATKLQEWAFHAAWPGMGLFGESYILFSVGTLKPIWDMLYPDCFNGNECPDYLVRSLSYSVFWGILLGMLLIGTLSNYVGRRPGSIITSSLMSVASLGMALSTFTFAQDGMLLFRAMSTLMFMFGLGVGGEYPVSASSAAEWAMGNMRRKLRHELDREEAFGVQRYYVHSHRLHHSQRLPQQPQVALHRPIATRPQEDHMTMCHQHKEQQQGQQAAVVSSRPADLEVGVGKAMGKNIDSEVGKQEFGSGAEVVDCSNNKNENSGKEDGNENGNENEKDKSDESHDTPTRRGNPSPRPRIVTETVPNQSHHPSGAEMMGPAGTSAFRHTTGQPIHPQPHPNIPPYQLMQDDDDDEMVLQRDNQSRGKKVLLVFGMQGMGIFLQSLTITALVILTHQYGDNVQQSGNSSNSGYDARNGRNDYYYNQHNYNNHNYVQDRSSSYDGVLIHGYYEAESLVAIWRAVYAIGAAILCLVLVSRAAFLEESPVWADDKLRREKIMREREAFETAARASGANCLSTGGVPMSDGGGGSSSGAAVAMGQKALARWYENAARAQSEPYVMASYVAAPPTSDYATHSQEQLQPLSPRAAPADVGGLAAPGETTDTEAVMRRQPSPESPSIQMAHHAAYQLQQERQQYLSHYRAVRPTHHRRHLSNESKSSEQAQLEQFATMGDHYGGGMQSQQCVIRVSSTMSSLSVSSDLEQLSPIRAAPSSTADEDKRSSPNYLLIRNFGHRLLGTASAWLLWDVAFYGNRLFQANFLLAITGDNTTLLELSAAATLNAFIGLLGYFAAAFLVDLPNVGRLRLQVWGFFVSGCLYVGCGFMKNYLSKPWLIVMYFGSSFFGQCGPNTTTYLIPAEIFPTGMRTMCHGISAASGKVGALLAALLFYYCDEVQMFLVSGYASFVACIVTFLLIPEATTLDLYELDRKWRMIIDGRKADYDGLANSPEYLSFYERSKAGLLY